LSKLYKIFYKLLERDYHSNILLNLFIELSRHWCCLVSS